ncbi:response regulator [Enterocloster sp.]|uniref:response regulator n=1 Tax=Enterocloster sp. TaxID=2719315 RepID=UPI0039A16DA4
MKTGRAVIEQVREAFRPDIAIVDIQMPGLSGIQAIREVRRFNSSMVLSSLPLTTNFPMPRKQSTWGDGVHHKPVNKRRY